MKAILFVIVLFFMSYSSFSQKENVSSIVLYEIAPKGFTSPNGPESGTFKSTAEKMPYLKQLGINTIWLAGYNLADSNHFYGIWTVYAVIRPDSLDHTMGTAADLKALVDAAHKNGINVFLDVITHGVMAYSSLITEHPSWFKGGSWGMTDYDWTGGHADLDKWWVETWTDYVLHYGVDGFRLDVSNYRPDLWQRIREICARQGKPISIVDEGRGDPFDKKAFDFYQFNFRFMEHRYEPVDTSLILVKDVAAYFNGDTSQQNYYYSTQLSCHDNGWQEFPAGYNPYVAEGSRFLFGYATLFTPSIPVMMSGEEWNADYKPLPRLSPDLFNKIPPGDSSKWLYGSWIQWDQLKKPGKQEMLYDVQKMLAIRTAEKGIIHAIKPGTKNKKITSVAGNYDSRTPVPYLMWNDNTAILVAGNNSTDKDLNLRLGLIQPLTKAGLIKYNRFKVTDLWNNGKPTMLSKKALEQFIIAVKKDKQPGGGVAVFKIEGL